MKKNIILIVVTVFLIMSFTACSKNESSDNNGEIMVSNNEVNSDTETNEDEDTNNTSDDKETNDDKDANDDKETSGEKETNTDQASTQATYELTDEGIIKPEIAKEAIDEIADKLIYAISTKDSEAIAEVVHPVKGVRFTPYTYVSVDNDAVFNQDEIKNFFENEKVYQWGNYDGSGNEISLTPSQYYDEFIYSTDFMNAEKIGYNEILSSGNAEENQFEVYENAIVVEYYFSGLNPDFGGADWKSLRLVFEQYENTWKLVGIIHNQMTI